MTTLSDYMIAVTGGKFDSSLIHNDSYQDLKIYFYRVEFRSQIQSSVQDNKQTFVAKLTYKYLYFHLNIFASFSIDFDRIFLFVFLSRKNKSVDRPDPGKFPSSSWRKV